LIRLSKESYDVFSSRFENIVADVLLILLGIFGAWVWARLTYRRRLQGFFNIGDVKRLLIYISRIDVKAFGAVGVDKYKMSYEGVSVDYQEMQVANQIKELFSFFIPKLAEASKDIGRLLLSDISVQVLVSPENESEIDAQSPIITLGSPALNKVSSFVEKQQNIVNFTIGKLKKKDLSNYSATPMAFSDSDPGFYGTEDKTGYGSLPSGTASAFDPNLFPYLKSSIPDIEQESEIVVKDVKNFADPTYGFVQRIKDSRTGRSLYYVAGLSTIGTVGAAHYLLTQWEFLYKKYGGEKPFFIMLRIDSKDYKKWTFSFEK
jgi:hypothetical protein